MTDRKGPVLIELEDDAASGPDAAPPVPEPQDAATGRAMQILARAAARPGSRLNRWFWRLLWAVLTFGLSLWVWDMVIALMARNTLLGYAFSGLLAAFLLVCLVLVLRELAAFSRLRRIDTIKNAATVALAANDLGAAGAVTKQLQLLYAGRDDLEWGFGRLAERTDDVFDAEGQLALVETELMVPLDAQAMREIETAVRQVATVTAIVPIVFADVAVALVANLRMIRRIAEIYGGRAGTLGSWRLARTVLGHLVATGAVAVGDDLITSVAGGGILSKLSRRFGEGIINGALTARVGVAAMEVCRPLPFNVQKRPGVTGLIKRSLAGLFTSK
ncbi:MAG: YcjF family protein [Paracoccaceae bacterium]